MKPMYVKRLCRQLLLKYVCIVTGIVLGGIFLIYLVDDVLNGVVIDFIRLFVEDGDPFELFQKIYAIVVPLFMVIIIIILIYFLCRDLVNYMRILMKGMEDVMRSDRQRVDFPKEMKEAEQLVMALSSDYQNYVKAAAEDEEKKKDLIYLLAQDIKLPLSNILMYLEFLHKERRISPEIQKDFVVQILHKSMDLEDMINEFFDITRFNLQYAKWNPEHMYLDRMMEQVVDEYYSVMEEKQLCVSLECGSALALFADNDKIARVFRDLLRNLVELGNRGATIHIRVQDQNDSYDIVMEVDSVPLSAYQIAHMFHNYYRLEDVYGDSKMHVLGLGIAKQIMDMQKGTLRASSIDGLLCFSVVIFKTFVPEHKTAINMHDKERER